MIDRKGITPVVAMIMLMLIVVSLAGGFLLWVNRTWSKLGEKGTEEIGQVTEKIGVKFSIDNVNPGADSDITLRNNGKSELETDSLTVYGAGNKKTCSWSSSTISPDSVETCTISGYDCSGDSIKVTGPGGAEDTREC